MTNQDSDKAVKGRLDGRIVLITGAANGLGRAMAVRFAAEGAKVVLADVDGDGLGTVVAEITAAGGAAEPILCDVTRGQDVAAMLRHIDQTHGKLDVLVNNAGVNVRSDLRHLSDDEWVKIRDVNLDGVLRLARDAFELLRKSKRGSLINVASIMGERGMRQLVAYSTTKSAVIALSQGLAIEYAAFDIRVNALCPGFVETAMTNRVLRVPVFKKALLDKTPLRRFGRAEEMAAAALFLASDDASYVTGASLVVDGGMSVGL